MQIFLSEQASNDKILVIILSFYIVSIQLSSVWVHRVLFYTCKTLLLVLLVIIVSFYFVSIQLSSVWVHKSAILHLQDSTSSAWEISIGSLSQNA